MKENAIDSRRLFIVSLKTETDEVFLADLFGFPFWPGERTSC